MSLKLSENAADRTDWPWVVRAMWVTPSAAAGEQNTFVWSDGSAVDYSHWFGGFHGKEGSGRSNEDEVEIRMGCDSWCGREQQLGSLQPLSLSLSLSVCVFSHSLFLPLRTSSLSFVLS